MKDVPCARHQLNTYCWSHELPRLHTVGQMVGTPTALSAAPSAPPPHCRLTGHHSIPTVGQLVIAPTYPIGQLVITPSPLSATPSAPPPHCWPTGHCSNIHCWPTGHHSIPTVGQLVITPSPLLADWSLLQHTLSAAPLAHQPHCRLTHY